MLTRLVLLLLLLASGVAQAQQPYCSNVDGASVNCDQKVTITSAADIADRRVRMINLAYGITTGVLPSSPEPTVQQGVANPLALRWSPMNVGRVDRFEVNGLEPAADYSVNPIFLYHADRGARNRLVLFNGGHFNSCDWNTFETTANLQLSLRRLLAAGYSVLAVNQPGLGPNCAESGWAHVTMAQQIGPSMLKWFLEPNNQIINWLEKHRPFLDYSMTGISGGSWEASAYSALDPRIHITLSGASGIPGLQFIPDAASGANYVENFVLGPGNCTKMDCFGETQIAAYYTIAGYMDQYVMAGYGYTPKYHLSRLHQHFLNFYDKCCWGNYQWTYPFNVWPIGYQSFFSTGGLGTAQCGGVCDYLTYAARYSKEVADGIAALKGGGRGLPTVIDTIANWHQISNCFDDPDASPLQKSFTLTGGPRTEFGQQLSELCGHSNNVAGYPDTISYIIAMFDANPPPTPAPAAGGFFGLLRRR